MRDFELKSKCHAAVCSRVDPTALSKDQCPLIFPLDKDLLPPPGYLQSGVTLVLTLVDSDRSWFFISTIKRSTLLCLLRIFLSPSFTHCSLLYLAFFYIVGKKQLRLWSPTCFLYNRTPYFIEFLTALQLILAAVHHCSKQTLIVSTIHCPFTKCTRTAQT